MSSCQSADPAPPDTRGRERSQRRATHAEGQLLSALIGRLCARGGVMRSLGLSCPCLQRQQPTGARGRAIALFVAAAAVPSEWPSILKPLARPEEVRRQWQNGRVSGFTRYCAVSGCPPPALSAFAGVGVASGGANTSLRTAIAALCHLVVAICTACIFASRPPRG